MHLPRCALDRRHGWCALDRRHDWAGRLAWRKKVPKMRLKSFLVVRQRERREGSSELKFPFLSSAQTYGARALPPIGIKYAMTLSHLLVVIVGVISAIVSPCTAFCADRRLLDAMPRLRDAVVPTALAIGIMFGSPIHTMSAPVDMAFANGSVRLDDPLRSFPGLDLRHPQYLGSGGGGAVFAYDRIGPKRHENLDEDVIVVKVSWVGSAASVGRECSVLKYMETNHVSGVERCRGQISYDDRRVMIAMEPVMNDSVASISEINEKLHPTAVQCVIRTLVQMLGAGVVTTDVQPLISKVTGEVLFIDMTEAKIVFTDSNGSRTISYVDQALASSFVSEMLGLIPVDASDELVRVANEQLNHELHKIGEEMLREEISADKKDTCMVHVIRQQQLLLQLLRDQATFMSQEGIDYIDSLLRSYDLCM